MATGLGTNLLTFFTGRGVANAEAVSRPRIQAIYTAKGSTGTTLGNVTRPEHRNMAGNVQLPGYDPNALGANTYYLC